MAWRWLDHTAELGLELEAGSDAAVFEEAAAAFGELVDGEPGGAPVEHALELAGTDRAELLVAYLEELVFLAETKGFIPGSAEAELTATGLRASVRGGVGTPSPLVKAVTYHDLFFAREHGSWRAHVVLDV